MNKIIFLIGILFLGCNRGARQEDGWGTDNKGNFDMASFSNNELKKDYFDYLRSKGWNRFPSDDAMMNFYTSREGVNYVPDSLVENLIGISKAKLGNKIIVDAELFLKQKDFIFGTLRLQDSQCTREVFAIYNKINQLVDKLIVTTFIYKKNQIYVIAIAQFSGEKLILNHIEATSMETRHWIIQEPFFIEEFVITRNGFVRSPPVGTDHSK